MLDTTALSAERRPLRERLLVSGSARLATRPSLVVLIPSLLLLLPQSDLPSDVWESWLRLKRVTIQTFLLYIYDSLIIKVVLFSFNTVCCLSVWRLSLYFCMYVCVFPCGCYWLADEAVSSIKKLNVKRNKKIEEWYVRGLNPWPSRCLERCDVSIDVKDTTISTML